MTGRPKRRFVRANAGTTPAAAVATSTEDLRREYYSGPGRGWEWWVVEIDLDPAQLIVENDSDGFIYRVPYEVGPNGEITFGEEVRVQVDYVDAPEASGARRVAASMAVGARTPLVTFASRAASRPAASATPPEEDDMTLTPEQLAALGLAEDATDEQITARLEELAALETESETETEETTETPPAPAPAQQVTVPDGAVLVDAEQWAEVQRQAAAGAAAADQRAAEERDRFLAAAVEAGKFAPARLEHWRAQWQADPAGARATIDAFPDGLIPLSERGHANSGASAAEGAAATAYPAGWLPGSVRAARDSGAVTTLED